MGPLTRIFLNGRTIIYIRHFMLSCTLSYFSSFPPSLQQKKKRSSCLKTWCSIVFKLCWGRFYITYRFSWKIESKLNCNNVEDHAMYYLLELENCYSGFWICYYRCFYQPFLSSIVLSLFLFVSRWSVVLAYKCYLFTKKPLL